MAKVNEELQDIGDFLEVPKDKRLDHDDPQFEDSNEDEFRTDFSDISDDGPVKYLSTATRKRGA